MSIHDSLAGMYRAKKLEPYVYYVRFPRYKNLVHGTRIEFGHPLTALVGANGVNKTSILRALYGVPEGLSTGTYWFATATDALPGDRATCSHGRLQGDRIVEVLKQRSAAAKTSDYWETSRPVKEYEMEEMPKLAKGEVVRGRSATRWEPITKAVVYLKASDRVSAFDKYFHYFGLDGIAEINTRKDFIRRRSGVLMKALSGGLQKLVFHRIDRITKNRNLDTEELGAMSRILNREYQEVRWIQHSLYFAHGVTVMLKSTELEYTEAFAGSGEFAVCQIVVSVLGAPERSLILIDEPEMFLHPSAQSRLMDFLADQIKKKKHQVIITTHAPAIIRDLPPNAIKVLTLSPSGEAALLSQSSEAETAFFHIGEPIANVTRVYVEDELAKHVVLRSLGRDDGARARFKIMPIPGGKSALWRFAVQFSALGSDDIRIILDGDDRPAVWPPRNSSNVSDNDLDDVISAFAGHTPSFPVSGGERGGNQEELRACKRNFIDWSARNIQFLPGTTPENFILSKCDDKFDKSSDGKLAFVQLTKEKLDDVEVNSAAILTVQREMLATIPTTDEDMVRIKSFLVQR